MNRVFMFRSWHETAKDMIYSTVNSDHFRWAEEGQPIVIMQYTGLIDRNGKEIYEGDILHDHKFDAGLLKVYWSDEWGGWSVQMITLFSEQGHEWLIDYNEGAEVIGSIYEHPKLLEG